MNKNTQPGNNQITIYQSPDGGVNIEVLYANENIWLTQKLIAQLFECSIDNVSLHLKNIFADGELDQKSVIEEYSITAADGKEYKTKHYSLEAIIAVARRGVAPCTRTKFGTGRRVPCFALVRGEPLFFGTPSRIRTGDLHVENVSSPVPVQARYRAVNRALLWFTARPLNFVARRGVEPLLLD